MPVASDLPGVRDTVADNGRLVEPGEPADLRRVLLELASDPAGVAELQERAPRRAEAYKWETTVDSYEKILSEEAARSGPMEGQP